MGIHKDNLDKLDSVINEYITGPVKMLELGDQNLRNHEIVLAKDYFESLGYDHTSIDIHGKRGTIKIDLRKPIPEDFINKFNIVTNFGTTEHVEPKKFQWQCFKNIHDACIIGGIMYHVVPNVGGWKDHCPVHYTDRFFKTLGKTNNYKIIDISYVERQRGKLIRAVFQKTKDEFADDNNFDIL